MKQFAKYAKPYLPFFIIGPVCMIVEVVGEVLMPKFLSKIIDVGIVEGNLPYIGLTCAGMILTALFMMAGGIGGAYFAARASVGFGTDLREDIYRKIQAFSFSSLDRFSTGSLVTRLTNDVTQLQQFVNMLLRMCLRAPGMLIGALIAAISMNARLATVLAVIIPLLLICQGVIIAVGYPRFSKMQQQLDALNANVQENITNVRVVKSFVREDYEKDKFARSNRALKDKSISVMKIILLTGPMMTLLMGAASVAVVVLGGKMIINTPGHMSVGDLTAFITYVSQILFSLMALSMLFMISSRAMASGKRVLEVLDETTDLRDRVDADPKLSVTKGEIEFRDVSFRYYKDSPEKVLDHISVHIAAGSTVGIIGSTGCGKSTLVSLIARLYDVDEGAVLIDGVDVRDYPLSHLRAGIGMVLQKNTLFSGSIAENLRWGDENASDDAVVSAAQSAQADGFVQSFSDGYDTILDQGGVNVSGGQKQRLCIARALLKSPKILILDDSTSAVDTATEARIRTALKEKLVGATKIIIAQRISSVQQADRILVMNDGKIIACGTHAQLLETCAEYREIYDSQMNSNKKEVSC